MCYYFIFTPVFIFMKKLVLIFILFLFIIFSMTSQVQAYSLKECAGIALENSFILKSYDSKNVQNDFKTTEILTARNPHVFISGSSSYTAPEVSVNIPLPPPLKSIDAVAVPNQYHKYSLEISKLLTSFGRIEAGAKYNEFNSILITYEKQVQRDRLLLEIVRTYYGILSAKEVLDTANAEKEFWEEQLKTAEMLFKNGVTAKYDLLRIKACLDKSEEKVITTKNALQTARGNLSVLMGVELCDLRGEPEDVLFFAQITDGIKNKETALQQNSSVMLAQTAILQSDKAIELAKLESSPYLVFHSGYSRNTETFISKSWSWQTSVSLNIPIYDGGERRVKVASAKELKVQATLSFEDIKRNLFWDIEKLCLYIDELSAREKLAETQIESSKESLRVAKLRYSQGLGTITELLDASSDMVLSSGSLERIKYEKQVQLASLSYLRGTIYNDLFGGNE